MSGDNIDYIIMGVAIEQRDATIATLTADLAAERAEVERLTDRIATLTEQNGELATNYVALLDDLAAERALADQLAVALAAQGSASFDEDTNHNIKRLALDAFKEARRER